jgi:hypothetical protein
LPSSFWRPAAFGNLGTNIVFFGPSSHAQKLKEEKPRRHVRKPSAHCPDFS